jgi:hypothetical protein
MLDAVRRLDGEHLDPTTMVLREPTLDDVFLALTGHTTADGQGADGQGADGQDADHGQGRDGHGRDGHGGAAT